MKQISYKKGRRIQRTRSDKLILVFAYGFLTLVVLTAAFPLYFVFIASVSDSAAVITGKVYLWPVGFTTQAYENVFLNKDLLTGYRNTIFYTVAGTALNLALTLTAGYVLSRPRLVGRRVIMGLMVFTMLFSGGLIPTYFVIKNLNLLDRFWVMILPGAISTYNLMITRTFIQSNIPDELFEAAVIDGCGHFKLFTRIVMPLVGALVGVIGMYYAVGHWNSYFSALLYITKRSLYPLQLILREILIQSQISVDDMVAMETESNRYQLAEQIKYALVIVASLPVLMIYPFIQKYFVKGIMIGSIKG